jgi:phage I-like protein
MATFLVSPRLGELVACSVAISGRKAPREFRIFAKGLNPSVKGDFTFDDEAAKSVMAMYKRMAGPDNARRVTFDFDHGALTKNPVDPSKSGKSAGECDLELRNGELWAVNVDWTAEAKKGIEAGEWPYISPAFTRDKDGKPTWLINIALTANPALFGIQPLAVAASAVADADASLHSLLDPSGFAKRKEAAANLKRVTDAKPLSQINNQINHPCLTSPLTWHFDSPKDVGGWIGTIEPEENDGWIAFISENGTGLLYVERDTNGFPKGEPYLFYRRDLATNGAAGDPAMIKTKGADPNTAKDDPKGTTPAAHGATVALDCVPAASDGCYDFDWRRSVARGIADQCRAADAPKPTTAPDHPAAVSPLTGRYADPLATGKWLGYIEPTSKAWIAFVAIDGTTYLWTQRNDKSNDTAPIGDPVVFKRDIATLNATSAPEAFDGSEVSHLHRTRVALSAAWALCDAKGDSADDALRATIETLSVEAAALATTLLDRGAKASAVAALGAVPFRGYPVDDRDAWDADAATHRLRIWASKDKSGDTSTIDFERYARGFAYQKPAGPTGPVLGDFLLPHHDIKDGEIVTVKRGAQAAAQRLSAADIPDSDKPASGEHIAGHYHQWGAKAPWENAKTSTNNGATTMHTKLNDFAKKKNMSASKLKAKLQAKGLSEEECAALFGDDEAKHSAPLLKKATAALDAIDDDDEPTSSERKEKEAATKHNAVSEVASIIALGAALGLPASASEKDVITGVADTLSGLQRLNVLTGAKNIHSALAQVDRWREDAEAGKKAIKDLADVKKAAEKREALSVVEKAEIDCRITPAQRVKAMEHFESGGIVALNVYLEDREPIQALVDAKKTPATAQEVAALNASGGQPNAPKAPTLPAPAPQGNGGAAPTGAPTDAEIVSLSATPALREVGKGMGKRFGTPEYTVWAKEMLTDPEMLSLARAEAAVTTGRA